MNIAILGVGTVGKEVANILIKNKTIISARAGQEIIPKIGLVRDLSKHTNSNIELTDNFEDILNRDDIDVFVELIGGVEKPFEIVQKILKKNKPIVTANKALLAYHRYKLQNMASNTYFGYEASVAGGIPIIKILKEGLSANNIEKIIGILNGTSNFILTNMMQKNIDFDEILKMAQDLGYAEADPTMDIGGFDAAHKLLVLASIAYGVHGDPPDVLTEGIENICKEDIYFANEFEYVIKLIAVAKQIQNNLIELRVHPALLPKDAMISKVDGVMNAINIFADALSESLYYGPGAGGGATASAVISDVIDIARGNKNPMLGFKGHGDMEDAKLLPQNEIKTKYYLRLKVEDKRGVLAQITKLMSINDISIDSFLQKPKSKEEIHTTLFFTTHICHESDIQKIIDILNNEPYVVQKPFMMRIEEI